MMLTAQRDLSARCFQTLSRKPILHVEQVEIVFLFSPVNDRSLIDLSIRRATGLKSRDAGVLLCSQIDARLEVVPLPGHSAH